MPTTDDGTRQRFSEDGIPWCVMLLPIAGTADRATTARSHPNARIVANVCPSLAICCSRAIHKIHSQNDWTGHWCQQQVRVWCPSSSAAKWCPCEPPRLARSLARRNASTELSQRPLSSTAVGGPPAQRASFCFEPWLCCAADGACVRFCCWPRRLVQCPRLSRRPSRAPTAKGACRGTGQDGAS